MAPRGEAEARRTLRARAAEGDAAERFFLR